MESHKKILYLQYTNPAGYPPLEHSSRILAGKGWDVLFLGTGSFGADNLAFPEHPKIKVCKLPFCAGGWKQKIHYLFYGGWVLRHFFLFKPDWIYASDPLSCPLALGLKCLGFKVVYHEHDSPQAEFRKSFFQRTILWTRKKLAECADLCVLPNEKRIEQFKLQTGAQGNVVCVWNCPSGEEVSRARYLYSKGRTLTFYYHGNISPELLPVTFLEALALIHSNIKLQIVGYETLGSKGYINSLNQSIEKLNLRKSVEILGSKSRSDLLKVCAQCDVGISLMPKKSKELNLRHMTGASNKPFDYLACGLALLVSDLPDWQEMYVKSGYGLACNPDDPESIAAALRWFLDHPKEMREMGERGRQRILEQWNYETQFRPVLEKLND